MARAPLSREEEGLKVLSDTGLVSEDMNEEAGDGAGNTPPYILVGSASIPVSKKAGKRWKDRIENALKAYDTPRQMWDLAYKQFRMTGNYGIKSDANDPENNFFQNDTDENLTRENVKTLLRTAYTRNPSTELSTIDRTDDPMIDTLEAVTNVLLSKPHHPGLNAKSRVRKWIAHGHLTNFGVLKLDFQGQQGSRAEAYEHLLKTEEELSKAKDENKLDELYAVLEQIEQELPTTRDPGMVLTNVMSGNLIVDPDCTTLDLSTAKWTSEIVMLSDAYIKMRFLEKDEDGKWVRKTDGKSPGSGFGGGPDTQTGRDLRETVIDGILGTTSVELAEVRQKNKTKCHIIWDRLTKQISLWVDGAWDYPLWVYRDDLKLSRFFPYFILSFTEPLDSIVQEGEASQYAGQAKEINKINKRVAFIRMLAFGTIIYNSKKLDDKQAEKIAKHMKNPGEFDVMGLAWDPEVKLSDMFEIFMPPDINIQALYAKDDLMKVVDRVNATSAVSRGEQFKTNTTNRAVEAYSNVQATVNNELTDAVEDAMADVVGAMLEIIVSKYTKEQVTAMVGDKLAAPFVHMEVEEFNRTYLAEIASGSTEKPTSENKKQEALQLSQSIGQVGSAAPATTLRVLFRLFKQSFSIFSFNKEDEDMLNAEAQANLQKGVSTPQQGGGQPASPPAQPAQGAPK